SGRRAPRAPAPGPHPAWQFLRFGDLAAYNLWHEDRTAAANGLEARVPFLDHRLVDLLCSIPRRWQARLFFDKQIERQAAERYLPSWITARPKVPLFRSGAGRDRSVAALRRAIVDRSFDQFRESYLESRDSLWSGREMLGLREQVA